MRKLIALSVVLVALIGADVAARSFAESKMNERAAQEAPPGTTVHATVGGFPFLGRLLLLSSISHVGVHVENLDAQVLVFASVDLDLHGVKLDRQKLISSRKVKITGIDRGTVTVELTQEALSKALGVPVTIADGSVSVQVLGQKAKVTPQVSATGALTFTGTGIARTFTVAIPKTDYVPCIGQVTVLAGRLRLSCSINEVPPALLDAAQRAGR